jgi:ABC-type lipoprotein release transport system permease subunit
MQEGSYDSMINNVVKFYSGYIQVQDKDFWENKTLYYSFKSSDSLNRTIEQTEGVTMLSPRLESFALGSSGEKTQAVMVVGIDPEKENQVTKLSKWIVSGNYLKSGSRNILLAEELAANLNVTTGDTIVLLGQGYYGSNEAERFKVEGILRFPSPELNKKFCYLDIGMSREFYSADDMVTSLVVMVKDYTGVEPVIKNLRSNLDPSYVAMSWDEMQPELLQMIRGDRAGGVVMVAVLYLIIAFGILGTVIMMMAERRKELAIMVAIGMQKIKLGKILFLETIYIGMLGVFSGLAVSLPLVLIMIDNPIPLTGETAQVMVDMGIEPFMFFSASPQIFINQVIIVFMIIVFVSLYPLSSVFRLNVIHWMRG